MVLDEATARMVLNGDESLVSAFVWDETPRGHTFWKMQYDHGLSEEGRAILERIAYGERSLHIEAGKYYRTRDGRKVGPMEVWSYDEGLFTAFGTCGLWEGDGSPRYDGAKDSPRLISEWPAEPVGGYHSCAAAEVCNLRDEYGWAATAKEGPKFKVGDRVVYDGHTAILREILDSDRYIPYLIEFESDVGYGHNGNNVGKVRLTSNRGWWVNNITAAPPATNPAIVARLDNGQPRPSTTPFVHADRTSAETEAKRLAGKYPGKEFGVYEFVSSAKEERRYEHEWQRLAAGGDADEAARKLRAAAGTPLMSARNAVNYWLAVAA